MGSYKNLNKNIYNININIIIIIELCNFLHFVNNLLQKAEYMGNSAALCINIFELQEQFCLYSYFRMFIQMFTWNTKMKDKYKSFLQLQKP